MYQFCMDAVFQFTQFELRAVFQERPRIPNENKPIRAPAKNKVFENY